MLTEQEVTYAYQLILGKKPENAKIIENYCQLQTVDELRNALFRSHEFSELAFSDTSPITQLLPLKLPIIQVETEATAAQMQTMMAYVQIAWQFLGKEEPFWSVCTHDKFKKIHLKGNESDFYQSGRVELEKLINMLNRNGLDSSSFKSCLEYGCGLGRVTVWLAQKFEQVLGCDISASHLSIAKQIIEQNRIQNISLKQINTFQDIEKLDKVDAIFSVIVLQHNPPPLIAEILRMLLRLLKPNGIAYFQVPTYCIGYNFSIEKYINYIRHPSEKHPMEMHVLPQRLIFQLLREENISIIEIREDNYVGARNQWLSNTFLVQKNC